MFNCGVCGTDFDIFISCKESWIYFNGNSIAKWIRVNGNWDEWSPAEQMEIYNRVGLRLFERSKDKRSELIKEARELQQSMVDIKI